MKFSGHACVSLMEKLEKVIMKLPGNAEAAVLNLKPKGDVARIDGGSGDLERDHTRVRKFDSISE